MGSLYERNPEALGKLFALSRSGNNGCYLLDDCGDDISGIADGILREKPGYTVSVSLEDRLMDGSEKQVQVTAETADGTFCGVASVVMPFSEIILSEEEDLNSEDLDSEDQDSSMEENPDETADPDVPEGQETLRDEPEGLPGPEEGIQEPEGTEELQETYETGSAGKTERMKTGIRIRPENRDRTQLC